MLLFSQSLFDYTVISDFEGCDMKGMRNIAPFGLRMPDELREAVTKRAKKNGRSINAEIVQILQDVIDNNKISISFDEMDSLVEKLLMLTKEQEELVKKLADKENKKPT